MKAIVVDDSPMDTEMISYVLQDLGYEVYSMSNGNKLIEVIEKIKPDLCMIDMLMPEKDGLETLMKIRQSPNKLLIIAMSSSDTYFTVAKRFGADHTILKLNINHENLKNILMPSPQTETETDKTENILTPTEQIELEAAAFRRLVSHLQTHTDVQNIELMITADFCRNCLAKWYVAAAEEKGISLNYETARERIYGMPYQEWKEKFQTDATPEQLAAYEAKSQRK